MVRSFITRVKAAARLVEQPNSYTCQSAMIAQAIGSSDVMGIRYELERLGDPGNPANMAIILGRELGQRYSYDLDATLRDCQRWLEGGEFLITHGWFTPSGHVIGLDGYESDSKNLSYRMNVADPWGEFMGRSFAYGNHATHYDGFYSSRLIYATCVSGQSYSDARRIYRRGELDSRRGGMWVHRVRP